MNSGCILLQCTDTGSCAYEHQIKGSGAPGNPTAMNGNVPVQWCDIPAWELAWSTKRELTAGHPIVQAGVDSSERAEWVLREANRTRDWAQSPSWPGGAWSHLQAREIREKEPWRTAAQRATSRPGTPACCWCSSQDEWSVLSSLQPCSGCRAGRAQPHLTQNSVQTSTSVPVLLHWLPGAVFGAILVYIQYFFFHTRISFSGYRIS